MDTIIGSRIKLVREESGYSQQVFASKLKIHAISVSRYEREALVPSLEVLISLVNSFSINANWLLIGTGNMHNCPEYENKDEIIRGIVDIVKEMDTDDKKEVLRMVKKESILVTLLHDKFEKD